MFCNLCVQRKMFNRMLMLTCICCAGVYALAGMRCGQWLTLWSQCSRATSEASPRWMHHPMACR
jgi:hypothetical protein